MPDHRVFEDIAPRLFDVDQDGTPEVIVVESDARQGARLSIYDEGKLLTATPFIGHANRWLAPVGIGAADLDGDGAVEVAYVDRPHLAKTLRIWGFEPENRDFEEVASLKGVTNHRIGEDYISGGIRDCGGGPQMIVADAKWRNIVAVRFDGEAVSSEVLGKFRGRGSFAKALDCKN